MSSDQAVLEEAGSEEASEPVSAPVYKLLV